MSILKIFGYWVTAVTIPLIATSVSFEKVDSFPLDSVNAIIAQNRSKVQQQRRVALVIGNANYQRGKLDTPLNDATDMAAVLKELGFEVILLKDASKRQMYDALGQFSTQIRQSDVGLFYFAGHGMLVKEENYILPVNAQIKAEKDVKDESISLGEIMGRMEGAENQVNIVILDSCRDNPFRSFSRSSSIGLPQEQSVKGTLIVFSTAPGEVASDGEKQGRNGLFTSYLLKYIKTPNLTVGDMLTQVRRDVADATNNTQISWESSSLMGRFTFNPTDEMASPTASGSSVPMTNPTPVTQKPSRPPIIESTPTLRQPTVCPGNEKNC